MLIQSTFINDLKSIKELYNSNDRPFTAEIIPDNQRKTWKKIKQSDFCKPSESELARSEKEFSPLVLRKSYGHNVQSDDYVFTCSYRTSQDFWRYEDPEINRFASQYPYIEEIIRLAVFVKMEPCRCIIFLVKLCFEKYWKKFYPLTISVEMVFEKFVTDFEQNTESVLHSGIFRDQKPNENLTALFDLFSSYYPATNFYYNLSLILSQGHKLISCGITDLSINAFVEKHIDISETKTFGKTAIDDKDIITETFESVFGILRTLAKQIIEKEGPENLISVIEDIEKAEKKLKMFYISCIKNKQKGFSTSEDILISDRREIEYRDLFSSGFIDRQMVRLINITEKFNRLGKTLHDDPYSVLHS